MTVALLIFCALVLTAGAVYFAIALPRVLARQNELARERMLAELEQSRAAHEQALENRLLQTQAQLARDQTQSFLGLAKSHLKQESELGRQSLTERQKEIDKGLDGLRQELENVRKFVTTTDSERVKSISEVAQMVKESRSVTEALRQDAAKLNEALAGSQTRGQWGERIADDVLRVAGFIEGVNYLKQKTTGEGSRPDFTFLLPDERKLHMDVKMPMAAFKRYLDAQSDAERDTAAKDFLRDTKQRIKEVTTRDYIDPADGTLEYTLVFIPNEQVYGFIHEQDPEILDYALQRHVVICSPLTLFAVLAVVRQSVENFRLEARTREIQDAIGKFRRQWDMFCEQMDKVGNTIARTGDNWNELVGKRQRLLERQIEKVDELRSGRGELGAAPQVAGVEREILELASTDPPAAARARAEQDDGAARPAPAE